VFTYETCCVNSTYEHIHAMVEREKDVSYKTIRKHCSELREWAEGMGYEWIGNKGLKLKDDYAVSFHKSVYRGRRCYFIRHSAIEHIWTEVIRDQG
jgi:hypothetical protein